MPKLSLSLLGPPQITLDGRPPAVHLTVKTQALLAYLAIEADIPHPRDFLAGLLWPDHSQDAAHNSLRQSLHQLSRALGDPVPPFLLITRQTVQFNSSGDCTLDVAEFAALIQQCNEHAHRRRETCPPCIECLQQAVTLYRGELLTGFFLKDSAAFEEWVLVKREQLARQALSALHSLTEYYALRGDFPLMEHAARRQIEIDPFRETAHRQVMRALAWSDQRSAALARYKALCEMLAQELHTSPDKRTVALYTQIESDSFQPPTPPPLRNWPTHLTPFIGRERELAQVGEYLQTTDVHLLTLVGPGGIGKTRLALQAGAREAFAFQDGACFVPLADVSAPELIISALASALHMFFSDTIDPQQQLQNYLCNKDLLLVLDSLEHLIEESTLISDLLRACPTLKILATSREGLDLEQEWQLPIQGLPTPDPEAPGFEACSAVQLFLQRAHRVQAEFALTGADRPAMARICALVGGTPLALELAAGWAKVLSCTQIAHEIEHGMDFLVTSMRDAPNRHRSMRAVFEQSWNLLSKEERSVFQQLAVFHGGFRLDAAEAVVSLQGASGPGQPAVENETSSPYTLHALLSSLVDKSLLQVTPSGRYAQHLLVRQYAEERLAESPDEEKQTRERHCRYYAFFVERHREKLKTAEQAQALAEMDEEIENIRTAWRWAVAKRRWLEMGLCLTGLPLFYYTHGWYLEGEATMGQAAAALSEGRPDAITADPGQAVVLGTILAAQGFCCGYMGQYEQAENLLKKSLPLLHPVIMRSVLAITLGGLGTVETNQGKHGPGGDHLQQGLAIARESGDRWTIAMLLLFSGHHARIEDLTEAAEYYRVSLAIFQELDDQRLIASSRFFLGEVLLLSGNMAEAQQHLKESLAFARRTGAQHQQLAGWSLKGLGFVASSQENYSEAQHCFQESLAFADEIGDGPTVVASHLGLGAVASALRDDSAAKEHLYKALRMAIEMRAWSQLVSGLIGWAGLLAGQSQAEQEQAVEWLARILSHPLIWQVHRGQAGYLLDRLRATLPPTIFDKALERGQASTLESTIERILGVQLPKKMQLGQPR
jgi:predicted ATPase/DNA-binding SARP family transcriptional activator